MQGRLSRTLNTINTTLPTNYLMTREFACAAGELFGVHATSFWSRLCAHDNVPFDQWTLAVVDCAPSWSVRIVL